MNDEPASVSGLIGVWPTIGDFAAAVGCGYEAARQMRRRERIAPQHWPSVVAASEAYGIPHVTVEWLARQWIEKADSAAGETVIGKRGLDHSGQNSAFAQAGQRQRSESFAEDVEADR